MFDQQKNHVSIFIFQKVISFNDLPFHCFKSTVHFYTTASVVYPDSVRSGPFWSVPEFSLQHQIRFWIWIQFEV